MCWKLLLKRLQLDDAKIKSAAAVSSIRSATALHKKKLKLKKMISPLPLPKRASWRDRRADWSTRLLFWSEKRGANVFGWWKQPKDRRANDVRCWSLIKRTRHTLRSKFRHCKGRGSWKERFECTDKMVVVQNCGGWMEESERQKKKVEEGKEGGGSAATFGLTCCTHMHFPI